jgi:hypothetical protein
LVLAGVLVLALPSIAHAQALDTITVTQRVLVAGDLTPAEAKRRAIEAALAEAVRERVGLRVQTGQLGVSDERDGRVRGSFLSVVQLDAAGRATDYRLLDERWVTTTHPALGPQLYYEVRTLVTLERETGAADAGFHVELSLNEALFHVRGDALEDNGEVVVAVTSTREAYLTVLAIADDSVTVLFPNEYERALRVGAGSRVEIPSPEWREQGLHLRASLPAGRDARRELIAVVATRTQIPFPRAAATMLDLQRWLVKIPLDQRAVAFAAYEVRRR